MALPERDNAECHHAESHYSECLQAESHYSEWHYLSVIMLSVISEITIILKVNVE